MVFDTAIGISLNQNLIVGPVIQDDLFAILARMYCSYVMNGHRKNVWVDHLTTE